MNEGDMMNLNWTHCIQKPQIPTNHFLAHHENRFSISLARCMLTMRAWCV